MRSEPFGGGPTSSPNPQSPSDAASPNLGASETQRPKPVVLSAADHGTVADLLSRREAPHRVLDRCRILKLSHDGIGPTEIARQVPWARQAICRLRARYRIEGITVLFDRPRGPRARPKATPPAPQEPS